MGGRRQPLPAAARPVEFRAWTCAELVPARRSLGPPGHRTGARRCHGSSRPRPSDQTRSAAAWVPAHPTQTEGPRGWVGSCVRDTALPHRRCECTYRHARAPYSPEWEPSSGSDPTFPTPRARPAGRAGTAGTPGGRGTGSGRQGSGQAQLPSAAQGHTAHWGPCGPQGSDAAAPRAGPSQGECRPQDLPEDPPRPRGPPLGGSAHAHAGCVLTALSEHCLSHPSCLPSG